MSIRFSHSSFPCTPDQKDAMAMPWGMMLQPLSPLPAESLTSLSSNSIDRCTNCFAYINPYVTFARSGWKCSLCRHSNNFLSKLSESAEERMRMPQFRFADVEYILEEEEAAPSSTSAKKSPTSKEEQAARAAAEAESRAIAAYQAAQDVSSALYDPSATISAPFVPAPSASLSPPAYLFLVDLSGSYNTVELLKSSLLAAIEALSPKVWVGLAVVSSKLGLYDLRCSTPSVSYVQIRSAESFQRFGRNLHEQPTSLPLHALMPLDAFLQQLEFCKEHLCTAIESLTSHQVKADEGLDNSNNNSNFASANGAGDDVEGGHFASPDPASATTKGASSAAGAATKKKVVKAPQVRSNPCGFGAALQALLTYLSTVEEEGFETNIRILSFLSQRPNWGLGALVDRIAGLDENGDKVELNQDDWNRFLFQSNSGPMAWSGPFVPAVASAPTDATVEVDHSANEGKYILKSNHASASEFYQSMGSNASQRGICIDTYFLGNQEVSKHQYFDLATLKYLSVLTGGNMMYYPSLADCTLPQDLFRQLRLTQGFRCMLRIRTSPEFQASNVYGHLSADNVHENLFHVGGCDARKVYAVDWEFCGLEGFRGGYVDVYPVVQIAFSYIGMTTAADGTEKVQQKLRILTRQLPLVHHYSPSTGSMSSATREKLKEKSRLQSLTELYTSTAPEVVLALLVHQVIHASLERGIKESREMLKEWMVHFLTGYQKAFLQLNPAVVAAKQKAEAEASQAAAGAPASSSGEAKEDGAAGANPVITWDTLDLQLSAVPSLQFLPRFLFALLKHQLISASLHVIAPDWRTYLQVLYSGLEADYLVKSIYPTLSSFSVDQALVSPTQNGVVGAANPLATHLHHPVLYLTKYSLTGCGDHMFVLDTYRTLFVLHTGMIASDPKRFPLPPPANSEVGKLLKRIKAQTPYVTPKVLCAADESGASAVASGYLQASPATATSGADSLSGNSPHAAILRQFFSFLIEDEEGGTGQFNYSTFLQEVGKEVAERINATFDE